MARLPETRVRIPSSAWMFVVYCVGKGPLRRADHSCREVLKSVCVYLIACVVEISKNEAVWARFGLLCHPHSPRLNRDITIFLI